MRRAVLAILLACLLPSPLRGQVMLSPAREGLAEIRADFATLTVPAGPITITPPAAATVRSEPGRVVIEWAIGPGPVPPPVPPTPTPNPPQPDPPKPTPTPQVEGKILVRVAVKYADFASYPHGVWDLRTSRTIRPAMAALDAAYVFEEVGSSRPEPGVYVYDAAAKTIYQGPLPKDEAELLAKIKALRGKP